MMMRAHNNDYLEFTEAQKRKECVKKLRTDVVAVDSHEFLLFRGTFGGEEL